MKSRVVEPSTNQRRTIVGHVVVSHSIGGLERVVMSLIRGIDRSRFGSVLCCIEREGDWVDGVREYCEAVEVVQKKPGLAYGLPFRLARVLKARNVDLVHCHNFAAFAYGSLAGRIARCGGVVYTAHGPDIPSKKRRRFFQRLMRADQMVAVSDQVRRGAIEKVGINPERVTTVENGIDVAHFAGVRGSGRIRSEIGVASDAPLLGMVARLTPEKDHETLLRAFALIVSQRPESTLVVVGDGPLRNDLEIRAASLELRRSVRFLGTRRDVAEILGDLDIFVLSSRQEGLPIALLEAMAAGLPVVATAVGGIPGIVVNGTTGLLVAPGDPEQIADAVIRLMIDRESAQTMGREGMRRVAERFDVSQMIHAYESLYTRILISKRRILLQ